MRKSKDEEKEKWSNRKKAIVAHALKGWIHLLHKRVFRPWWCGPPFMGGDSNFKHNIMSDFFHAGKLY